MQEGKVHFYWFSKNTRDKIPEGISVCITSFKKFHPEFTTILHTNLDKVDDMPGLDTVRKEMLPPCPHEKRMDGSWVNMAHAIDYKRLQDAISEGGVFLDLDFTFIRRLPDEFLYPKDGKVCAYNIYDGWHPSFCIASFSVEKPGNQFLTRWMEWYAKDYNVVDYNWNGNFIGGLAENYHPGCSRHLGTGPLYDYVPAGKMDWNFRDYYSKPGKEHVCAVHWGTCYVISVSKKHVNAWTSARHFVETGKFLEDFSSTGNEIGNIDFSTKTTCKCHIYIQEPENIDSDLVKFVKDKESKHGTCLVHCENILKVLEYLPEAEVSPDMDIQTCFKKSGGIHLLYRKKEATK